MGHKKTRSSLYIVILAHRRHASRVQALFCVSTVSMSTRYNDDPPLSFIASSLFAATSQRQLKGSAMLFSASRSHSS